jgi:hypothetical protein
MPFNTSNIDVHIHYTKTSVHFSLRTQYACIIKTNPLMLHKQITAVYSASDTKHINTLVKKRTEPLNDYRRVYIPVHVVAERGETIIYLKYLFLPPFWSPLDSAAWAVKNRPSPVQLRLLFSVSPGKNQHDKRHTVSSLHCRQPTGNTQIAQCSVVR